MMKIFLNLFSALTLLIPTTCISQTYEPMLGQLNEWHVTACFGGCNTSTYYTDGDTIVGGLDYKILDGYHYSSRTFLLREDIAEKQVFLVKISPTKIDEFLMYDFSLQVGDSIELFNPVSPYPLIAGFYKLDSIVSKPLEDLQLYRHFYLSPVASNTDSNEFPIWIESVGSLSLINGPASTPDFNGGGQLSCYFKDGESRYLNMDSIQTCDQAHFLSLDYVQEDTQFNLFPNPSINSFKIITNDHFNYVQVFNLNGENVLTFNFQEEQVYNHNLKSGVYYIRLIGEHLTTQPQKFIIIK